MIPNLRFALRFYLPLASSIGLIFLSFFDSADLVKVTNVLADVGVQVGIIHFQLPAQAMANHNFLFRVAVLLFALTCTLWALGVDFSKYVPKRLRVKAHFRVEEIEKTIKKFFSEEQQKGSFESSWKDLLSTYDDERLDRLAKFWEKHNKSKIPARSEITRDVTAAEGITFFRVKRNGLLSYEMLTCTGHLKFEVTPRQRDLFHFTEKFELLKTPANDIKPKFSELLRLTPSIILKPEFKQIFLIDDDIDSPHDHTIVAMTRLTLLPFPVLSSTLYLWKMDDGRLIPIGYGNYYELSDEIGSTVES